MISFIAAFSLHRLILTSRDTFTAVIVQSVYKVYCIIIQLVWSHYTHSFMIANKRSTSNTL